MSSAKPAAVWGQGALACSLGLLVHHPSALAGGRGGATGDQQASQSNATLRRAVRDARKRVAKLSHHRRHRRTTPAARPSPPGGPTAPVYAYPVRHTSSTTQDMRVGRSESASKRSRRVRRRSSSSSSSSRRRAAPSLTSSRARLHTRAHSNDGTEQQPGHAPLVADGDMVSSKMRTASAPPAKGPIPIPRHRSLGSLVSAPPLPSPSKPHKPVRAATAKATAKATAATRPAAMGEGAGVGERGHNRASSSASGARRAASRAGSAMQVNRMSSFFSSTTPRILDLHRLCDENVQVEYRNVKDRRRPATAAAGLGLGQLRSKWNKVKEAQTESSQRNGRASVRRRRRRRSRQPIRSQSTMESHREDVELDVDEDGDTAGVVVPPPVDLGVLVPEPEEDDELEDPINKPEERAFDIFEQVSDPQRVVEFLAMFGDEFGVPRNATAFLTRVLDFSVNRQDLTATWTAWGIISEYVLSDAEHSVGLPADMVQRIITRYRRSSTSASRSSAVESSLFQEAWPVVCGAVSRCIQDPERFWRCWRLFEKARARMQQ